MVKVPYLFSPTPAPVSDPGIDVPPLPTVPLGEWNVVWCAETCEHYLAAAHGILSSPLQTTSSMSTVTSQLNCGLDIYRLDYMGNEIPIASLGARRTQMAALLTNQHYIARCAETQGFVAVFTALEGSWNYKIDSHSLMLPNNIGKFPDPDDLAIIPADSPRIVVGVGEPLFLDIDGKQTYFFVIREQYWKRESASLCIAPGEDITVSYTITSGTSQSSTSSTEMSAQLGLSAGAGWGPISASLSASLSKSSRNSQEVSLTEERTHFYSNTIANSGTEPQMLLRWQLTDVISTIRAIKNEDGSLDPEKLVGIVESMQNPVLTASGVDHKSPKASALKATPEWIKAKAQQEGVDPLDIISSPHDYYHLRGTPQPEP